MIGQANREEEHMSRHSMTRAAAVLLVLAFAAPGTAGATGQNRLEKFVRASGSDLAGAAAPIESPGRFSGYTNYWQSLAWSWRQHGNLFLIGQPDIGRAIAQNQADIAEELGLPGLVLDEGFLDGWLRSKAVELDDPAEEALAKALDRGDVLVWADPAGAMGAKLLAKAPGLAGMRSQLGSHQARAAGYREVFAVSLADGERRLFAVLAKDAGDRRRLRDILADVRNVVGRYDLHRGWFGTGTLLHSVTCHPGHPLEVIGQGLSQGNDWFTFSGYMDFLMLKQLPEWLRKVGLDIPVDVGTGKATHSLGTIAYGLKSYDGLKIQDMPTEEEWIKFVKDRGGYLFRPVFAPDCDKFAYDGQIAIDGNKKQIDTEDAPFILQTGLIKDEAPACMVLFAEKGRRWTREEMWRAILDRRAVGILPLGRMMGPESFRSALQMLLLDRVFLETRFADGIRLEASVEGYELNVRLANFTSSSVPITLEVRPAPELAIDGRTREMVLPPGSERAASFRISPSAAAMAGANPVLVEARWTSGRKRTLAVLDLPPAVSVHKLLHGEAPEIVYPVSIHNFTEQESYPIEVRVYAKDGPAKPVLVSSQTGSAPRGGHQEIEFRLPLRPGAYTVRTTALGASNETQLGVGEPAGQVTVTPVDLDGDGLLEYRLENDKVRVTLLAVGARVIEYVVKEKNDNVLFKLWPEKEHSDRRPFRERGFYPYGGFEDFLGQASIETHKVYDAEVVKGSGTSASVRMTADYYGNKLEKVFTLDGSSPLLEVRFALEFRNPELNMLGPQPILALGEKHGTEDVFVVPARSGLREARMRPEEYFGEVFFLKEGWNAGRDTVEDVSFVGAFPVSEPEFLHMWMNHPSNGESAHYYAEFQPWVPIFQKTVRYFSYYLWGAAGPWERGLEELRRRNLITTARDVGSRATFPNRP
jgi:hypothetical protein